MQVRFIHIFWLPHLVPSVTWPKSIPENKIKSPFNIDALRQTYMYEQKNVVNFQNSFQILANKQIQID